MADEGSSCKHHVLRVIDILVGCIFIAPLVVLYWRTTWKLMDIYVFPSHSDISGIICTVVGFTVSFIIVIIHPQITYKTTLSRIIWRASVYLMSLSCISFWRGIWLILDHTTTMTWMSYLVCHSIAFAILSATKTVSSIVSPPGFLINDFYVDSPTIKTVGFKNNENRIGKTICNGVLTVMVVGTLVVTYWRGTWSILDYITVGISGLNNSILSFSVGCGVCIIGYITAEPLKTKARNVSSGTAVLMEHVFVYFLGVSVVNVWRGVWSMCDILILQGNPAPKTIITHFLTLLMMYFGQAAYNLIGSPIGCRTHDTESFEGFSMGSFLKTQP
ncbi:uncharacterized protein LOC110251820 [Exaiptasia diaphana]|uniref:Uncharacterized protein n=1 Tax=Exaiptasia diaphana TaxID=2652724 RepID=A0A913Y2U3_EXADI|nr:uncharacterized protein LOC110251820 [Exaiptasia diaphana]